MHHDPYVWEDFESDSGIKEEELHDLVEYEEHHHDEIVAGDHHDPNCIELFCDQHPDEPECLIYDD